MRFLIQRVREAEVTAENKRIGRIGPGCLVFLGISHKDTVETADRMIKKLIGLRIFEDENGKTNLDIQSVQGQLLIVSQFTLYADCKHGNRPSFTRAGAPEPARVLYEYIIAECQRMLPEMDNTGLPRVETGEFGADMKISLINDGPFTVILDSEEIWGS